MQLVALSTDPTTNPIHSVHWSTCVYTEACKRLSRPLIIPPLPSNSTTHPPKTGLGGVKAKWADAITQRSNSVVIHLSPLTRTEVVELVRATFHDRSWPEDAIEFVMEHGEGNPSVKRSLTPPFSLLPHIRCCWSHL